MTHLFVIQKYSLRLVTLSALLCLIKCAKKKRSFDQRYYQGFVLNCSTEQCAQAWQIACREFESQKTFGMWNQNTTFCSKLVGTILHESGICCVDNERELNTITPSRLFANISTCSTPLIHDTTQAIDFKPDEQL